MRFNVLTAFTAISAAVCASASPFHLHADAVVLPTGSALRAPGASKPLTDVHPNRRQLTPSELGVPIDHGTVDIPSVLPRDEDGDCDDESGQDHQRREVKTLAVIMHDAASQVADLSHKLNLLIATNVNVKADLVLAILNDVLKVVLTVVTDVKGLAANPTEAALMLEGTLLSPVQLAYIVSAFIYIVVNILSVAQFAVGTAQLHVIAAVVAQIGAAIAAYLQAVVVLSGGVLVQITPLLHAIAPVIAGFGVKDLNDILKLN